MIKNVLTHLGGIGLYGVISVCLFFTVFSVALILAMLTKRPFLVHMSALPLADDSKTEPCFESKGETHHE
ncbi:MAG TPA: hypothetical protein PLX89_24585 [Verrucomicrobiota bacterium]|nr:hypothetical protein [Verrucomicrobiales bacterium]HRI16186.1 hypothetical protein [Verrucomicrobiota bacterium]